MSNIASAQHTITEVDDGIRGTGIYNITTAPTAKTQTVGDVNSSYYISLATAKTQSGQSQILIGDQLTYSYYLYPVVYVDGTYVYCGARTSIRGATGAAGKGVQSTVIKYAKSTNGTDAAAIAESDWKDTIAAVGTIPEGQFLWTRTVITYTDGSAPSTSYSVSKQAVTGYSVVGSITQSSLEESYWTTLGTVDSTHTWSNSAALGQQCRIGDIITIVGTATDTKNGHTIYAKVTGFNASGNIITKCISHMIAERGEPGGSVTITSTETKYAVNQSGTSYPTDESSWKALSAITPKQGDYVWTRTIVNYSPSGSTTSYSVARQGTDGISVTIKEQWVRYKVDTQGSTPPTSGWQTNFPTSIAEGQYLWTETYVKYSDNSEQKTHSVSLQGKSVTVTSTVVKYTTSTSATAIPDKNTGGWQSTIPATDENKKYLWTWTRINFSAGDPADSFSVSSTMDSIAFNKRNYCLMSDIELTANGSEYCVPSAEIPTKPTNGTNFIVDLSVEIKVTSKVTQTSAQSLYAGFQICYANTAQSKIYREAAIKTIDDFNNGQFPINTWVRIHNIHTTEGTFQNWVNDQWSIFVKGVTSGQVHIRRPQIAFTNVETDWTVAPEDLKAENEKLSGAIADADTVANNAVLAAGAVQTNLTNEVDAIITQLDGKASQEEYTAVKNIVDADSNKIKKLDEYRVKQQLNAEQWQLQFARGKGQNLIQNSVMKRHTVLSDQTVKPNFWVNSSGEIGGVIDFVQPGDSEQARAYTDSNYQMSFAWNATGVTQPKYCFSSITPYVVAKDNLFLSFKAKGSITKGTFFIGWLAYHSQGNYDTSTKRDTTLVISDNNITNCYYAACCEYVGGTDSGSALKSNFQYDWIDKEIIRAGGNNPDGTPITNTYNESLDVQYQDNIPYIVLTYMPTAGSIKIVENGNTQHLEDLPTNTKITGRIVQFPNDYINIEATPVVTVQYSYIESSYVTVSSEGAAATVAQYSQKDAIIPTTAAGKYLYVYNPLKGQYVQTTIAQPQSDMEINSVRLIIGMRPNSAGEIDANIQISDLKLEYDTTSQTWTSNVNETYSKQYRMDEEGFSIASATNTMFIDEDEIAAYRNDEKGEKIIGDPVFQIKEENTILKQTTVRDKISIEYMDESDAAVRRADAFVMQQVKLADGDWYFLFY